MSNPQQLSKYQCKNLLLTDLKETPGIKIKKPTGRFTETQRKVHSILTMPEPVKKEKRKPFCMNEIVSVLNRFEKNIDVAIYLSK